MTSIFSDTPAPGAAGPAVAWRKRCAAMGVVIAAFLCLLGLAALATQFLR